MYGNHHARRLGPKIIHALYVDPRAPFNRLAEVLGSSEQTISRRYRRLFGDRILRVVGQLDSQRFGQYDWGRRGAPLTGVEFSIRVPSGRTPPTGETRAVSCMRGGNIMVEYWRQPEATAAALA